MTPKSLILPILCLASGIGARASLAQGVSQKPLENQYLRGGFAIPNNHRTGAILVSVRR